MIITLNNIYKISYYNTLYKLVSICLLLLLNNINYLIINNFKL